METKELGNYILDILNIEEFKSYYYENRNSFSGVATNSFLKALDIPPKFFKEQPEETQAELLENREVFVRENKKFFNKVIVVVKTKFGDTLNAARLDKAVADSMYEKLKPIDEISIKFEHRSFTKDGYVSFIISDEIKKGKDNQVLAIDFPILLNKPVIIHEALYTLPDETFVTPIEHIQYLSTQECAFTGTNAKGSETADATYTNISEAIVHMSKFITSNISNDEFSPILREEEIVALALVEAGTIPKSALEKVRNYLTENSKGQLSTKSLEKLVLDFDETFTSYKQVTALRSVKGTDIWNLLESDKFKEFIEEMDKIEELALA